MKVLKVGLLIFCIPAAILIISYFTNPKFQALAEERSTLLAFVVAFIALICLFVADWIVNGGKYIPLKNHDQCPKCRHPREGGHDLDYHEKK